MKWERADVTAARNIVRENLDDVKNGVKRERERYLANNPHLIFDKTLGKIVPKTVGG